MSHRLGNRPQDEAHPPEPVRSVWRLALPGFCASLVGIGLARFAYTPLLPALIAAGWFDAGNAAYLGAANLAGYLAGVLVAGMAARKFEARSLLRGAMLLGTLSLLACAAPLGFGWFFVWRLLSGVAGAVAMVLAAPAILPHVPPARHGLVSGSVFMGVGVGVALSGTFVPVLERHGLMQTWFGLGMLAATATAAGWGGWPVSKPSGPKTAGAPLPRPLLGSLRTVYACYGLNAFALVPHMVFLVAYVARGLGEGLDVGTRYWILFGLGSIAGPVLAGRLADRIGFRSTLTVMILVELAAVGLLACPPAPITLGLSSVAAGACTIGIVPVVLGRTRTLLRPMPAAQPAAWRAATTSFALLQAAGAYVMSFALDRYGDYRLLFALGAVAACGALVLDMADRFIEAKASRPSG